METTEPFAFTIVSENEITSYCHPLAECTAKVKYVVSNNGPMVIVVIRGERVVSLGTYLIKNLDEAVEKDYFFRSYASTLGITPETLRDLIKSNKPVMH